MSGSFNLLIKGGQVVDGTGSPWFKKDIGISEGKIVSVGFISEKAEQTIDAEGMVVSPGFIDLHTHNDLTILAYPNAESHVMQGITTAVTGNCGLSMAPVNSSSLPLLKTYVSPFLVSDFDYGWSWETLNEYYEKVERQGSTVNLVPLVGQGTIRLAVKGFDKTEASKEEMGEMKKLLAQSLEDGAFGMSTGLAYTPGSYSSTEELIELTSVLREYGALYVTHMRNESSMLMESVEEAIKIGEETGIAVQISHHKEIGKANWGKVHATLRVMEQARRRGVEVNCDVYPYTAASTTITVLVPPWSMEGGIEKLIERLKDKEARQAMKKDLIEGIAGWDNRTKATGWDNLFIGYCPPKEEYEGKSFKEIFKSKGHYGDAHEGFFELLLEIKVNATIIAFMQSEDDVRTVMSNPMTLIISDSWVTSPSAGGKPHPRAYGTFPRVLGRYVREERVLTLEDAIRKMTSLPAGKVGLEDRGVIKEGLAADIVIFDPAKIRDRATYAEPHQYPEGIAYVIVNGQVVVDHEKLTGVKTGKVLRK